MRRAAPAAAIYLLSVGLLLIGELVWARSVTSQSFGEYQLARNALPLVSLVALWGADQALMRATLDSGQALDIRRVLLRKMALTAVVAAVTAILLHELANAGWGAALTVVVAAPLVAATALMSAGLRGQHRPAGAAWLQQGYRVIVGALLLTITPFGMGPGGVLALAVGVACAALSALALRPSPVVGRTRSPRSMTIASSFALVMIPAAALDFADQLVIATVTDTGTSGSYALWKLVYFYPTIAAASILSFVAVPWAHAHRSTIARMGPTRICLVSLATAGALSSAWAGVVALLGGRWWGELSAAPVVVVLFAVISSFRLAYVVPSAINGAFSSARDLRTVGAATWVALGLLLLVFLAPPHHVVDGVLIALAVASILRFSVAVWTSRTAAWVPDPSAEKPAGTV